MSRVDELNAAGLKVTAPRLKVLEVFRRPDVRHLGADEVYRLLMEQGQEVGLATVYRVLSQFEQAKILRRCHLDQRKEVYELDGGEHHDHFVCDRCGRVAEFYDDELKRRQHALASVMGFELQDRPITIHGTCERCSEHDRTAASPGKTALERRQKWS